MLHHKLDRAALQTLSAPYAGGRIAQLRTEPERARQRDTAGEVGGGTRDDFARRDLNDCTV
ncbi:MAG: hypothetical protein IT541_17575 [Hyphomicrobiales bacterium]|nr:hypothetical protein [Hyphomicrobiales bacterium]